VKTLCKVNLSQPGFLPNFTQEDLQYFLFWRE
jgi:hypothetical protein